MPKALKDKRKKKNSSHVRTTRKLEGKVVGEGLRSQGRVEHRGARPWMSPLQRPGRQGITVGFWHTQGIVEERLTEEKNQCSMGKYLGTSNSGKT